MRPGLQRMHARGAAVEIKQTNNRPGRASPASSATEQTRRLAMRRSGTGSGGGIGMNKNVEPRIRTGQGSKSARPAGVAQIGNAWGNKATHVKGTTGYTGERLHNPERNARFAPFGNAKALDVGGGGCGTGRTLYGQSGSQGLHGQPAPGNPRPSGELFPGWPAKK